VADIVELSAYESRSADFGYIASQRGIALPEFGRFTITAAVLSLRVRPARWLLLSAPGPSGGAAAAWQARAVGSAAVVDLSSALSAFVLSGTEARALLARGCRLDLDPGVFRPGCAAATIMAQVSVVLAALPAAILLLSPRSTARHLREWLMATGRPFALTPASNLSVSDICGERSI
jgi:sarcosine oxidase subunit gamma